MAQVFIDILETQQPVVDIDAPLIFNLVPADLGTSIARNTNVNFYTTDAGSGINLNSIIVEIDSGSGYVTAFTGGAHQSGYAGSVTPITDGYIIQTNPNTDFPEFTLISARATVSDNAVPANQTILTWTFTTDDETSPSITNRVPAPDSTGIAENANITFTLLDTNGSGIDESTLDVTITEFGSPASNAIVNGVFQAGWNGGSSVITPSGTDTNVVIDKTTNLVTDQLVTVFINVDDNEGNNFQVTYSFSTADLNLLDAPIYIGREGGGPVSLAGTIVPGTYRMYVGNSANDPELFNGIPGSGNNGIEITTVSFYDTIGEAYIPTLPVGGPYDLYLVPIGAGSPITITDVVNVLPSTMGSRSSSLKRTLPPKWKTGPRRIELEEYPQE